ncbi:helix-turn-helix domain-containing protein [Streptomyces sp. NPDC001185]|uniref:helix-turn-helix domain-containing protein n=1 Tax=Streptomyces sp. NPDC001185 TaxID=3154380 RepID=UPI003325E19B
MVMGEMEGSTASGGDWTAESRLLAVTEVLNGMAIAEVARRYGTSRQSLYTWLRRFREGGRDGLNDRSHRPHSSPTRVPVEVELMICQQRRSHPGWSARRIVEELASLGIENVPNPSTIYRILVRNGLVNHE